MDIDKSMLVHVLQTWNNESEDGRRRRDDQWTENWNTYWQKYDFSNKAPHQFRMTLPEGTMFVERFSAAMKEALVRAGEFFTVEIPAAMRPRDPYSGDLGIFIRTVINYWLDRCGQWLPDGAKNFNAVFEDAIKNGSLMLMALSVTWEEVTRDVVTYDAVGGIETDPETGLKRIGPPRGLGRERRAIGQVAIKVEDPRRIWFDPTGRGLYRRRRYTLDGWQLQKLKEQKNSKGQPVWDAEAIDRLGPSGGVDYRHELERQDTTQEMQQHANKIRRACTIDEYLCNVLDWDGKLLMENALVIMADSKEIIRGPEPNPYLHGRDWVIATPLIRVPGFPYGRSFMEVWGSVVAAYTEFFNVMLDSALRAAVNAQAGDITQFEDPSQVQNGIAPGTFLQTVEGADPRILLTEVSLGRFYPELTNVLSHLKSVAQEGAAMNDIIMGQVVPGRRTASEVQQISQSAAALIRSMAQTIEDNLLSSCLEMVWYTSLQYMDATNSPDLVDSTPEELRWVLDLPAEVRKQMFAGQITVKVRGISGLMARELQRQAMLTATGIVFQSRDVTQIALQNFDVLNFVKKIFDGFGVDTTEYFVPPSSEQMRQTQQMFQEEPVTNAVAGVGSGPGVQGEATGEGL